MLHAELGEGLRDHAGGRLTSRRIAVMRPSLAFPPAARGIERRCPKDTATGSLKGCGQGFLTAT